MNTLLQNRSKQKKNNSLEAHIHTTIDLKLHFYSRAKMLLLQSPFHTFALLPNNATHGVPPLSLRRSINFPLNTSSLRRYGRDLRKQRNQWRCYAAAFSPNTLQWVSAVSSAVLMVTKGSVIQKSFLVPLFALQAPPAVISWVKGRYGIWTAFLALLIRLFYIIPGELELPFLTMLLVISAPYEALNLRGSQAGVIISLAVAAYLAFQHFSKLGSLQRAFDQASFIATSAIICIISVNCLLLI